MTTALDVVKGALRAIQVLDSGEEPEANEGQDALTSLNLMIHGWRNKSVNVQHVDLVLSDVIKLEPRHHEGLIYLLAIRLAPDYNQTVSAEVVVLAESAWRGIQSHYIVPVDLKLEGLSDMPSRRWGTVIE